MEAPLKYRHTRSEKTMRRFGEAKKREPRISNFYGGPNEDFKFCSMRPTTAFRSRELIVPRTQDKVRIRLDEKAVAILMAALRNRSNQPFKILSPLNVRGRNCTQDIQARQ